MEANEAIYNDRYKYGYDFRCYMKMSEEMQKIMQMTGASDKNILDVGCGVGWFTNFVYYNVTRKVKGIDFSNKAINMHAKRLYPVVDFERADVYDYNYTDYNAIIIMEVLEHLENDLKLLRKFEKGSSVYISVPFGLLRQDPTHVRIYNDCKTFIDRYKRLIKFKYCEQFNEFILAYGIKK